MKTVYNSAKQYKDLSPHVTVEKSKKILRELNIIMEEEDILCTNGLYSMRLRCKDFDWHTNGKGVTPELCRASAYGEAMERIQNLQFHSALSRKILGDHCVHSAFCYYPDELEIDFDSLMEKLPLIKQDMINSFFQSDGKLPTETDMKTVWTSFNGSDCFRCIPFYDMEENRIEYLPYVIVQRLARSNGMAAGNTPQEALTQSISEILERYAQNTIYRDNLTPPSIPAQFIKDACPYLHETIITLSKNYKLSIYILDASLGAGLPVLCLLCINQNNQSYRVKFGAHPIFEIALQRCLTELAQGNDFSENALNELMVKWSDENQKDCDTLYNWGINHRKNLGSVPNFFFYKDKSWEFVPWKTFPSYDNHIGLSYLLDICKKISSKIYIRDNSFMDFPSYWVYIPGISPTYKFHPLGIKTLLSQKAERILYNPRKYIVQLSTDDKAALLEILKSDTLYCNFEFWEFSKNIVLAALYLDAGHLENSICELKKEHHPTKYVLAAIRELELRRDGILERDRDEMLSLFFGEKVMYYVRKNWRNKDTLKNIFYPFNHKRADDEKRLAESRNLFLEIDKVIKQNMIQCVINQNDISQQLPTKACHPDPN